MHEQKGVIHVEHIELTITVKQKEGFTVCRNAQEFSKCLRTLFDPNYKLSIRMTIGMSQKTSPADINLWQCLLANKIATHNLILCGNTICKDFLFSELIQSPYDVPENILDFIYSDGISHGCYKHIDRIMGLCRNKSSLEWFLQRGYKFHHVYGRGESTMEHYIYDGGQFLPLIMDYPESIDRRFCKKHLEKLISLLIQTTEAGNIPERDAVAKLLYRCTK